MCQVEVTVEGIVDENTGMVVNVIFMNVEIMKLINIVDHKFLDKDVPFFGTHQSTVENIAVFFWENLVGVLPTGVDLAEIKVYETEDNIAVYRGN